MLQHRNGHMRVYERKNERFANKWVVEDDGFDGGSDMMWGATSYNKRTPLVLVPDNCIATRSSSLITRRERFLNTRTPDSTQHVQLSSTFLLTTTSLCYHGHPDGHPDLNPMDHLWDRFDKRVYMHQPARKRFCKSSRHYKNNGKEHPRSNFNV